MELAAAGPFEKLHENFASIEILVAESDDQAVNTAVTFWDAWIDARDHEWRYHAPINRSDWQRLALAIAADLRGHGGITDDLVRKYFGPRPRSRWDRIPFVSFPVTLAWASFAWWGPDVLRGIEAQHVIGYPSASQFAFYVLIPGLSATASAVACGMTLAGKRGGWPVTAVCALFLAPFILFYPVGV